MRIERVFANAFGPLADATLDFAPGLTIVYGPNESGKSSWHAALYVGLCGVRRARGRGTTEDQIFEALHKPWDGARWEVGTFIRLEDGRRVELQFDLAGRVDCFARDTVLGRDVSNEIMNGTPDASKWLGLDRRSFLATACIQQADLLSVLSAPELLQEHMQRAAATAGTDATAAAAIACLEDFRRERVGADRVHGRRPLRVAKDALQTADADLRRARQAHDQFSELAARADRAAKRAAESDHDLHVLRAGVDASMLAQLAERLARARELAERYPTGAPPGLVGDEELLKRAAAAIRGWEQAPEPISLAGPTSRDIRSELDTLPELPSGDLEPDVEVVAAGQRLQRAEQAIEFLGAEPSRPVEPRTTGVGEQRLLELARDLEVAEPPIDPTLDTRVREAQAAVAVQSRSRGGPIGVAAAGVAAVAAMVLLVTGLIVPGLVGLGVAGAAAVWTLIQRSAHSRQELYAVTELRKAEASLGENRYRIEQISSRRRAALAEAAAVGLSGDPAELRLAARELVEADRAAEQLQEWQAKHDAASEGVAAAKRQLANALEGRGAPADDDVHGAYAGYITACRERTMVTAEAKKRLQLETALRGRLELESAASDNERIRVDAAAMIVAVAVSVGSSAPTEEAALGAVKGWQARHASEVAAAEVALREWAELEGILNGRSIEELEADVEARRRAAA